MIRKNFENNPPNGALKCIQVRMQPSVSILSKIKPDPLAEFIYGVRFLD